MCRVEIANTRSKLFPQTIAKEDGFNLKPELIENIKGFIVTRVQKKFN